jgi:alpha-1,2-mannosyltransferase
MVVAGALWLRWWGVTDWNFIDLRDFVQGGRSVLEGGDVYGSHPGVLAFNYPPFGAVVFVPLAVIGLSAAKAVISVASLFSYAVIVSISARATRVPVVAVWLVALGGLALEPVTRTLILGQVNLILVAAVLVDIFVLPRRYRGVLIGIAAGVKLTPGLFALYYVLKRDWMAATRAALTGALTVACAWLAAPAASLHYWLGGMDKLDRFGLTALTPANQSLRAVLVRVLGVENPPSGVVYLAAAAALGLALLAAHRQLRDGHELAAVTCLAVGALLVSPITWTHHWVWVVPALMVMVQRGKRVAAWATAAVFYFSPMFALPTGHLRELGYSPAQLLVSATYAIGGLVFLLWMVPVRRSRPAVRRSVK